MQIRQGLRRSIDVSRDWLRALRSSQLEEVHRGVIASEAQQFRDKFPKWI